MTRPVTEHVQPGHLARLAIPARVPEPQCCLLVAV
jgi:hypothetical protein